MQRKRFSLFLHFLCSVVCLSVVCRLSHSCLLLKPFDGFRCHLAGKLVRSNDTSGVSDPQGKGRFGGWISLAKTCNSKLQINHQSYAATWRTQTRCWVDLPQRFRLLPSYFGSVFVCLYHWRKTVTKQANSAVISGVAKGYPQWPGRKKN